MSQKFKQDEKIHFKDLQSLLQKSFNDKVRILSSNSTKFLPLGENYCSTMVKLDATICRNDSLIEEKLHLVAKTTDQSEQPILDWTRAFRKEVFIYSKLLPAYRDLERKMGVKEAELIDILPKYYGHRYSLKDGDSEVDPDSVLLMENLKARGFYSGDRLNGMKNFLIKVLRMNKIVQFMYFIYKFKNLICVQVSRLVTPIKLCYY